jgi:DNA-binding response OmpR family regulator
MNAPESSKKVLIIDDDQALAEALSERLTEAGYSVSSAFDGQKGLDVSLETHPDLIILDVAMPVMNGWDALTALRADGWGKDARVVMLTNSDDMENVSHAIDHGSTEYLIKGSWTLDDIVAKVGQMIA